VDESFISLDSILVKCRVKFMIGANIIENSITIFVYKTLSKAQHTSILNWKNFKTTAYRSSKFTYYFRLKFYYRRVLFIWKLSFVITEEMLCGGRQRNDRRNWSLLSNGVHAF